MRKRDFRNLYPMLDSIKFRARIYFIYKILVNKMNIFLIWKIGVNLNDIQLTFFFVAV